MAELLCSICARGGSKGLKNKNIKKINGLELIAYSIYQAKNSKLFKHIVVSTDSEDIMQVAKKHGACVFFKRSKELSSDEAAKMPVIRDCFLRSRAYFNINFDYIIELDASAPLRSSKDIKDAFAFFLESKKENLISATRARKSPYFNQVEFKKEELKLCKKSLAKRRQDSPEVFDMNASIYIFTRDRLLKSDKLFGKKTALFVMNDESAFDIDTELDFKVVEFLLKQKNLQIKDF